MNKPEDIPSREAPSPHTSDRVKERGQPRTTAKQWLAVCCVICLLIALFLFMHGGEF